MVRKLKGISKNITLFFPGNHSTANRINRIGGAMTYQGKASLERVNDQKFIDEINRRPTLSRANLIAAAMTCLTFAGMLLAWAIWG